MSSYQPTATYESVAEPGRIDGSDKGGRKIAAILVLTLLFVVGIGCALYFGVVRPRVGPNSPGNPTTFALMALGGDCTQACVTNRCVKAGTSSTFVAVGGGSPLVAIVDGAPVVTFNIPGLPASYQFPTTAETSAFLTAVLVAQNSSGGLVYDAAMFNASAPTSGTVYPPALQYGPVGGDEGAGFASYVAQSLKPRSDGLTNVALLLVLNNGPAFFATALAQGFPTPGNSAWNVLTAMESLGPCPVWTGLAYGSQQGYCAAYNFTTKKLTESTATPNCVAGLAGVL